MPPSVRRPRAAALLVVAALAAAVLPGLAAPAAASGASGADGWRVLGTGPVLTERLAGPPAALPVRPAAAPDRRSRARTGGTRDVEVAGAARSVWRVSYDAGFQADPVARGEFQRAVDTWAALIGSPVPITVDANFRALGPRVLGSAGPADFVEQVRDGRYAAGELAYPIALGNAKAGRDLAPPTSDDPGFDIIANFPNDNPSIHYGRGPVPPDEYDFYSTALHEIAHGLGFTSFFQRSDDGRGTWGATPQQPYLLDFDTLVTLGSTAGSTDLVRMTSGSTALGAALTSRNLYWRGARAVAANGGARPKLYAPSPYQPGSSTAHLDEAAFPPGTADALMTPSGAPGELNADVGEVALAMLGDVGWSVPAGSAPSPAPTTAPTPPATVPAVSGPASRFTPLTPARLLDTRTGLGAPAGRVGPGGTVDVTVVGGQTGVPATATAVVLNVTAVGASSSTDVRAYPTPSGSTVPTVSNLNLVRDTTRAGVVTVPVGRDGQVRLRNSAGTVGLLADLAGWYAPDGLTAYHPVSPLRLLDTREDAARTRLGPGESLDLQVAGVRDVPASAAAVVLTVTGVGASASTDLAVYPSTAGDAQPGTSNVNLVPGPPVANLVVVKVGDDGRVRLRNSAGSTAVLVDLSGWFDATAPDGQLFRPVSPVRLFDTRSDPDPDRRRLGPGTRGSYRTTTGAAAVPATATAVLLTVTGVAASSGTDVRVYPRAAGDAVPVVSNLNLGAGQTVANAVVARTGTDGDVVFRNQAGSVALLSDLAGWFGP